MRDREDDKRPAGVGLLQDLVLDSHDVEQFLTELVSIAGKALSGEGGEVLCGVTLIRERSGTTVASNSPEARKMDEIQYQYDDGPCLREARDGSVGYVPDADDDDRFPNHARALTRNGIKSALGVPIPLEGRAKAALNFYSPTVDAFSGSDIAAAQRFAEEVSASLNQSVRIAELTDSMADLRAAMENRTTIDLAAGVIMGQNRCSMHSAREMCVLSSSNVPARARFDK